MPALRRTYTKAMCQGCKEYKATRGWRIMSAGESPICKKCQMAYVMNYHKTKEVKDGENNG